MSTSKSPATFPDEAVVIWHDLECGAYRADLPLWRALAAAADGPVLDLGAGTGRVALDLAGRGHPVTAVERDPHLLAALAQRSRGLNIATVAADARALDLGERRFALCLVPMQTIQLLGGRAGRSALLGAVHRHLRPGGRLSLAVAEDLAWFEARDGAHLPPADVASRSGWTYRSQPVAVRPGARRTVLERRRETVSPAGERRHTVDRVALDRLVVEDLEAEAETVGFEVLAAVDVPATDEHVGSRVAMLRAPAWP